MEANRVSLTEQGRGDAGADEDSKVHVRIRAHTETETEKEQETLDDGLFVFLKRLRVTPQVITLCVVGAGNE
uniref:Uncharacterized protein n=1 Tax=Chromera velia CCMP2878 TaxID=1169474 RepID=A0A0K6SBE7_9ALVE|eukprot:Cvel_13959.t2-p1 / transcript=Cvel_13959.t2 / gene=Cvel_13959 / organism=Chromera_velia_CCMP2878 / gene_product=hypothetical protein / transcript_product=hypothetical protein / location=Cvel_scaffold975:4643-5106(+) / protein_length=71 / sequence_SO=supercontig / SO=protein_coding / is_pseudo=false